MRHLKEYKLCSNCRYFIPKRSKIDDEKLQYLVKYCDICSYHDVSHMLVLTNTHGLARGFFARNFITPGMFCSDYDRRDINNG